MAHDLMGNQLHDKDGMTPARAEAMVAEVMQTKADIVAAFLLGDHARVAELKRKQDSMRDEARRLNRIRQQKIVGVMGPAPHSQSNGVAHG